MAKEIYDVLTPDEQKKLELQLTDTFVVVQAISQELQEVRDKGKQAKDKAESVQIGFLKNKNKAIDSLKDAVITNADTTLATLDVVDRVSENQKRMADACGELIKLGAVDLANNRAVVEFIEKTMRGGADKTLTEETKAQLIGVIQELKQKEDLLIRQKKQAERINEHENRIIKMEAHATELEQEIASSRETEHRHDLAINFHQKKGKERDQRLSAGEKHDLEQDEQIDNLQKKNIEQDMRLEKGDKTDQEQDKRLDAGEKRDLEQDAILEEQKKTDIKHDEQLVEHDKLLSKLDERIQVLERDVELIKNSKKTKMYITISTGIGIIGVILGILGIIL